MIEVEAGEIHELSLDKSCRVNLEHAVVSDSVNNPEARILATDVFLYAKDVNDNNAILPPESKITCQIRRSEEDSSSQPSQGNDLPRLSDAIEGILYSEICSDGGYFPCIQLESNAAQHSFEGQLNLWFHLHLPTDHPQIPVQRSSVMITFHFTTQDTILEKKKSIKSKLIDIKHQLQYYVSQKQVTRSKYDNIKYEISVLMNNTYFPGRR